jgi:CBS domain containing-hemolysin-like protein
MVVFEIGLLILVFLATLSVSIVLESLPPKELHRRARSDLPGNEAATRIGRLAAYGMVAKIFIWLIAIASIATLLIWAIRTSLWLGAAVLVFENLAALVTNKLVKPGNWLFNIAGHLAAAAAWLLHFLDPLWTKLPKAKTKTEHSRLYENEDIVELLERQVRQPDNRTTKEDLETAKAALGFNDKKVSDVAVALKDVRLVLPDESIGPHLMDELYVAGHSVFPVGKKVGKKLPPELSGVVYLDDLVENSLRGNVNSVMVKELHHIGQAQTLNQALESFLKYHNTLLIVDDERDEPVGVIWLEDVLEQLLGRKISPDIDNPADADAREKMVE